MIWVDDSGISAGAATESTGFVSTSILEMCMRQKLPVIHLVESAGANLLKYKVELWSRFGNVFAIWRDCPQLAFLPWWCCMAVQQRGSVHARHVRLRYWRKGKRHGRAGWRRPRKGRNRRGSG